MAVPNQKIENLLNLALDATPEEREKSAALEVGYSQVTKKWELIVKYSGSLDEIRNLGVEVEEMRNEYAILTVPELLISQVTAFPQIEYVEKPKSLFFAVTQAKAASCIDQIQQVPPDLTGKDTLVGVLDSGIDYYHDEFRNPDGTTRILGIWDQTNGEIYTEEQINQALAAGSREAARAIVPSWDGSGHGTAVAGIAAGNRGVAYDSKLLIVKLGIPASDGFPRTTELMRGVNAVINRAVDMNRPVAVNISFGNTYGSHDGSSLLETYLDDMSNFGRTSIIVGSGNEGAASGHTSGFLTMNRGVGEAEVIECSIAPYETGISLQLWKGYVDQFTIQIQTPRGDTLPKLDERIGTQRQLSGGTQILIYYGKPNPYSLAQEIYFDFIPVDTYLDSGIWKIILTPTYIVSGNYDFWLPSSTVRNASTVFLRPTPETTLTIPSSADKVITVGAYDAHSRVFADFSGRGYTRVIGRVKPDLIAPGVNLSAPQNGGGYGAFTGTSFAAPMVTGSAALLMEWGIVKGNDIYLYGEKMKAYLRRGAKQLPGFTRYPNQEVGYGVLCVADSFTR